MAFAFQRNLFLIILVMLLAFESNYAAVKSCPALPTAKALGWVFDPNPNNLCGGYYREPLLDFSKYGLIKKYDSHINADRVSFSPAGRSYLIGHVMVKQPNKQMQADKASFTRDAKRKQITTIELTGNIRVREPGKLLLAKKAKYNLIAKTGELEHVHYRLARSDKRSEKQGIAELFGVNAWGNASHIKQLSADVFELYDTTYSACPPIRNDWQLSAKKIHIDQATHRGSSYNTILRIKNVPVAYFPYFNFALDDKRSSGFLIPTISYTSKEGIDLTIPYYWNIAPNMDMTFSPEILTMRGVLFGVELRQLSRYTNNYFHGTFMPADRKFKKFRRQNPGIDSIGDNRGSIYVEQTTAINPRLKAHVHFDLVSDDYYLQDFHNDLATTTDRQLLQQADLQYQGVNTNFVGRLQNYQTLHPANQQAVSDVYGRLPQFLLDSYYPSVFAGTDFGIHAEFVNFNWPGNLAQIVDGVRTTITPTAKLPLERAYGYLTPTLTVNARQYFLSHQMAGVNNRFYRTLPIVSVDAGLYFDRFFQFRGKPQQLTLEPRAFYLYVPFENQDLLPLFDSGINTFTYAQLFRTNRFSGGDRVGDANQVALALTSRWIEQASGVEKLRFGIGTLLYFQNRKVAYCTGINCSNTSAGLHYTSPTATTSPIASELAFQIARNWSGSAELAWDPQLEQTNSASVNLHYQNNAQHILNFSYQYQRAIIRTDSVGSNSIETGHTIGASAVWPANKHWSFLGTWSYNLAYNHSQTYYLGTQYDSCCWAFRLVGGRTLRSVSNTFNPAYSTGIYFQILLKGLGTIAARDPGKMLASEIPGYRDIFREL